MLEVICDMTNAELRELLAALKKLVLGEVKKGGRRVVSVSGDGHATTYDLGGIKPASAYRAVRNELVRRGCLEPKPRQIACVNLNPCKPDPCCKPHKEDPCAKTKES